MKPQHLKAKAGDIAERVIVAGDPARVVQVSKMLENSILVNENRGFITYTGTYNGKRVSVACHGVGGPSSAIVFEELIMLGAKVLIRLGSTGAFVKGVRVGELVIATGASYIGGTLNQYVPDVHISPVPSFDVTLELVRSAEARGIKCHVGPVFSSEAFYAEDHEFAKKWYDRGHVSVEMECATLFGIGMLRKVKTGAILIVSDNLAEMTPMVDATALRSYVDIAARVALDAIIRVEV
ncbi:MAG: purine-nucleoside phosphorylase [Aigarchaeota archaeon]|nr:purine-nucleoside phosphorylase [Aigarchaeota archaeon]MDW8093154.1 purine-nucleoside phosphorylase [Nitrososphaerota archaeon]